MKKPIPIYKAWKFCPRCGSASARKAAQPFACADCGYSHYFSPCTAVGAVVVDDRNRVLFIIRGKDPGKGLLGLPGGFVDASETAEEALIREVQEELNLDVTDLKYLASFPNSYAYRGVIIPVTDLFFVAHVADFGPIAVQEGEVDGWKFVSAKSVKPEQLAFETHRKALKVWRSVLS